jgi:hypothetical protein
MQTDTLHDGSHTKRKIPIFLVHFIISRKDPSLFGPDEHVRQNTKSSWQKNKMKAGVASLFLVFFGIKVSETQFISERLQSLFFVTSRKRKKHPRRNIHLFCSRNKSRSSRNYLKSGFFGSKHRKSLRLLRSPVALNRSERICDHYLDSSQKNELFYRVRSFVLSK